MTLTQMKTKIKCEDCDGTGLYGETDKPQCLTCTGTGLTYPYPFDSYPDKYSQWMDVLAELDKFWLDECNAVANLRNIIDDCATAPSIGYESAVDQIHRYAVAGLKALGADLI